MRVQALDGPLNNAWSLRALQIIGSLLAIYGVFQETFRELFNFWWNYSSYNHCILIIPISLFLIYEKRAHLLAQSPGFSWLAVGFYLFNCMLWIVGALLAISALQHASVIGMVIATIWGLIGSGRARVILFPLLYLYFGVPEGEVLVPYLQDLTAEVVVTLLRITGIPVFLEGRYLTIPSGNFHVAKACSGINYLIATLAVSTVFAYLRFKSNVRRALFMILALLVPLVANGFRAYGIVMIAHLSDYKYAMGIDHFIYGWVFFGIVIFFVFSLGNFFSDVDDGDEIPITEKVASPGIKRSAQVYALLVIALLVGIGRGGQLATAKLLPSGSSINSFALSSKAPWQMNEFDGLTISGEYLGQPQVYRGSYLSEETSERVDLEFIFYPANINAGEAESRSNKIFDDEIWRRISGPENLTDSNVGNREIIEHVVKRSNDERIIWSWYEVAGVGAVRTRELKLTALKARLLGNYLGTGLINISTSSGTQSENGGRSVLARFLEEVDPSVEQFMLGR